MYVHGRRQDRHPTRSPEVDNIAPEPSPQPSHRCDTGTWCHQAKWSLHPSELPAFRSLESATSIWEEETIQILNINSPPDDKPDCQTKRDTGL